MGARVASGTLAGSTSGSSASIHEKAARSDFSRVRRHPRVVRFAHLCRRSRGRTSSSGATPQPNEKQQSEIGVVGRARFVRREARRRESAVVCQQPPGAGSTQFGGRRRSRPRGVGATIGTVAKHKPAPALPKCWIVAVALVRFGEVATIALEECARRATGARFDRTGRSVLARIEQAPAPPSGVALLK